MKNIFIDLLAFGTLFSSVLVITSKNPVIAVTFLIAVFVNAAGYLILKGIGFIGISYIIVYVGAITVLFLFIIMMINIRLVDLLEIGKEYTKNFPLAILIGTIFIYEIYNVLFFTSNNVSILNLPVEILNYFNILLGISSHSLDNTLVNNLIDFSINSINLDFNLNQFLQIGVLGQALYTYGTI